MKSTKVKRGRPSNKDKSADEDSESVAASAKNWDKGAKKKLAVLPPTEIINPAVNTIYHYKDGGTCAVYLSWCKEKPIDIRQS